MNTKDILLATSTLLIGLTYSGCGDTKVSFRGASSVSSNASSSFAVSSDIASSVSSNAASSVSSNASSSFAVSSDIASSVSSNASSASSSSAANFDIISTGNPRVNQRGYLPGGPKVATYANSDTSGLPWKLYRGTTLIHSGVTTPHGQDAASGEYVHMIDFSNVNTEGEGYTLHVGNDVSYPFMITKTTFSAPLYDALRYFYHNRSGIAIETDFTGGGHGSYAANSIWARPAGHLNMGSNKGDYEVACWSNTCDYALDVTKGWYDAGDHGKYVVNGGISVWKLLNAYERAVHLGGNSNALGDNMLNIPESGNGVSDILDEARWELEFLLSMQVPEKETLAGMVHHKMHDEEWTGLPMAPHEDPKIRYLVPPSTAATLNLAAVAAQAARIWADIDEDFSKRCLLAAQRAWNAAQAHPDTIYDGAYDNGGGGYGDSNVSDEFIWAASELFITTGEHTYVEHINTDASSSDWNWQQTKMAGILSLATVPASHTAALQTQARNTIVSLANGVVTTLNTQGYLVPLESDSYYWGSNNGAANRLILIGSAYDYTGDAKYALAFGKGLDYFFGHNALSMSYITGYGEHTVKQPHHRFWAGSLNSNYPWAPPGAMVGGPNPNLEDEVSSAALSDCKNAPQTCHIDKIGAWSTNEITINWNGALVWMLAFYNDLSDMTIGAENAN